MATTAIRISFLSIVATVASVPTSADVMPDVAGFAWTGDVMSVPITSVPNTIPENFI
jgi:hypothetical protein